MSTSTSTPDSGARKRSRVHVVLKVHIACLDQAWTVHSKNISLKGLLCTPNPGMKEGQICDVRIALTEELYIQVQSKVVRSASTQLALDFIQMDEASFHHLRNLIRLNASDPDSIENELKYPAFVLSNGYYGSTQKK
ncbi:MAG: PilZ domain-containing protein [Desulfovermiculus sp.]